MDALKTYLLRVHGVGGNSKVTEMVLPLEKDALLSCDVEADGMWSFYRLAEEEDYELDFEVWGYYNAAVTCG